MTAPMMMKSNDPNPSVMIASNNPSPDHVVTNERNVDPDPPIARDY